MRDVQEIVSDNSQATLRSYQTRTDLPTYIVVDTGKFIYQVFTFNINAYAYVAVDDEKFGVHQHAVERAIALYEGTQDTAEA